MTDRPSGRLEVEVLADPETLAVRATAEVLKVLGDALERRPVASWVLAGGSTPRRLYELLALRPGALDWRRVELFWGDERCVEPSSAASNFGLARQTLLQGLPLAANNVHRIHGELPPAAAARDYELRLRKVLQTRRFDLVLLGLGSDGHVASLFPGALPDPGPLVAAVAAPVEPRRRVTMTAEALSGARRLLFLVHGRGKAAAVARALDAGRDRERISDRVRPRQGGTLWLLDRAAAAELAGPPAGACGSLTLP